MPARTTARMAAFIPGASPPLVKTAILFMAPPARFLPRPTPYRRWGALDSPTRPDPHHPGPLLPSPPTLPHREKREKDRIEEQTRSFSPLPAREGGRGRERGRG